MIRRLTYFTYVEYLDNKIENTKCFNIYLKISINT